MKYIGILFLGLILLSSCKEEIPKEWAYKSTVKLEGVNPIGIANVDGKIWLSDGDHNRLIEIKKDGTLETVIDSLDRPMHIDSNHNFVFVPQYGNDKVELFYPKSNFVDTNRFERKEIMIDSTSREGAFFESLKRNNSKIREDRAKAIVEDAQIIYRREVEDLSILLNRLKREQDNMLDLSPTHADSLVLASDFNAKQYVAKDLEIAIKVRNLEIKQELAEKRYEYLFGKSLKL